MIYILWLLLLAIILWSGNEQLITDDIMWTAVIAIALLPIWSGIRDIVNELRKINKHLEKKEIDHAD